jgi:transglutaminase superfamily protein
VGVAISAVAATAEQLDAWIERLRRVPAAARTFDVGAADAERIYGLDGPLLDALDAAGIPRAQRADGRRYAEVDLHYLGLRLGTARTHLRAMSVWTRALARAETAPATAVEIRYVMPPGAQLPDAVGVRLPGGATRVVAPHGSSLATAGATLRGDWLTVGPAVRELLEELADLELCLLPFALRGDTALVRRTRLSDCMTAAQIVIEECRARGIEARFAHGLLVAPPFASAHSWAEVRVEDAWTPVDPVIVEALKRFAGLDADAWPCSRSPGALFVRVCDERRPLVFDGPRWIQCSYVVTLA